MDGILRFKCEAKEIHEFYPELIFVEEDLNPRIVGELILQDEQGLFVDSYQIKIEPIPSFPSRFPYVFETGGRIPVNIDWHVFPDGHCCIKSIPEEALICKQGISLIRFLEQQVKPYFFNQKYREINGFFLNERSHGLDGNIEFFEEKFNTKDLAQIVRGLYFIKQRKEPNRVEKCFCGSDLKYRKCHRDVYRLLEIFSNDELEIYINMIIKSPKFKF